MADILNLTLDQKQDLSDKYDAQKLVFESKLEKDMRRFFKEIAEYLQIIFSATGDIINFDEFQKQLEVILRRSYRETSKLFSEHYEREMQKQQDEGDNSAILAFAIFLRKDINRQIFIDIDDKIKKVIPLHASSIIDTTKKVIADEIDKANIIVTQSGEVLTDDAVIKEAIPNIKDRNLNRVPTIAETEVGTSAGIGSASEDEVFAAAIDDAKKKESSLQSLGEEDFQKLQTITLTKTWISLLDDATREAHLDAHGQEVDVFKPYIVAGELMMQPLDSSLGASLGNIINCRCNSIST